MRRRPPHNYCMDGEDLRPVLLDLLDIIAGRNELPPDPNEEPLSPFDENGNWNLEKIIKMNKKYMKSRLSRRRTEKMATKEDLIRVFEDTEQHCKENERLRKAIEASIKGTRFYREEDMPTFSAPRYEKTTVSVYISRTLETAMFYHRNCPELRIAAHNFASATNPGGGVRKGSRAQEEALCRCSTLLPVLETEENKKRFYDFHRQRHDVRYTDACLYTPDVVVFKTDDDLPSLMPEDKWTLVDILTCAAPNLRAMPNNVMNPGKDKPIKMNHDDLFELHQKRARHLLAIAAENKADVLILGAFGCGAFQNPPELVAEAYHDLLPEFEGMFKEIVFSIYCTPRDTKNYHAFAKALEGR